MAEHIKIVNAEGTWVIRAGGAVLGETKNAIELVEGDNKSVIYFPRKDVAIAFFEQSETTSHCPHKGDASHYSIQTKSRLIKDAAWAYNSPLKAMDQIKEHLAFYPGKVTVEQI